MKIKDEPIEGDEPEENSYDEYLDNEDLSSCMAFKLNEDLVYAENSNDYGLTNEIWRNPTKKELETIGEA